MHLSSKISSALLVSLCWVVAPVPTANSCSGEIEGPTTQLTLFNRSALDLSSYMPRDYRFDANSAQVADVPDYERNCREWATFLGKSVDWHDVYEILYNTKSDDYLNCVGNGIATAYPKNSYIRALVAPENAEALNYLMLAKQAEFMNFASDNPWYEYGENQQNTQPKGFKNLFSGFESGLKSAKSDFMKQRFAYQILLFNRYSGLQKEAIKHYEKYFKNDQSSVISLWALLHYAECIPDKVAAQFYFSRIYDLSPHKRTRTHQLRDESLRAKVLERASNDHERATVLAYYNQKAVGPILDDLQVMFQLDPQNKFLPQLVAQEINKVEDWISSYRLRPYTPGKDQPEKEPIEKRDGDDESYRAANLTTDLAYLRNLRTLTGQAVLSGALGKHKDFLKVATAHLFLIDHKPNEAQQLLRSIDTKASPAIKLQQKTGEWMLIPLVADVTKANVKSDLLARYQYLETQQTKLRHGKIHLSHLLFYLARAYEMRGDKITAWLLLNRSQYTEYGYIGGSDYYSNMAYLDTYASVTEVERAVAFIKSGTKTAFEKWLLSNISNQNEGFDWDGTTDDNYNIFDDRHDNDVYNYRTFVAPTANQLTELAGTIALRENKLDKSLALFAQLPADYWQKNYEFSDYLRHDPIAEKGLLPSTDTSAFSANKANVVRRLIALRNGPKTAQNLYLLAGAYFNMSYYGNAWIMTHYGKSSSEIYNENAQTPDGKDYYQAMRALETYQLALEANPSESLKARIELMQHHIAYLVKMAKYETAYSGQEPVYATASFKKWLKTARKADFWDALSTECPNLNTY